VDEVSLDLEPPLHSCWMKQGQQKIVPALQPGTKQHRHLFGAYCWNDDQVRWKVAGWKNSQTFIEFLEYLLVEQYPSGRIVLVMDNVSYHKSAAVLAALSLFEPRVLVFWLPPYCPELNLIERYWKHLKELACANRLQNSMDEVVTSAEFVLSQQNEPASILRLTFSKVL
jgi:DDE superfamily endonuclease